MYTVQEKISLRKVLAEGKIIVMEEEIVNKSYILSGGNNGIGFFPNVTETMPSVPTAASNAWER